MVAATVRIGAKRLLLLAFMVMLFALRPVAAATVRSLEVTHNKETYLIVFDVLLAAEPATVREFLSDYTQWPRLSHKVREAHLLKTFPDGRQRIGLSFRSCALIFCKTIRQVKDVTKRPNGDIFTVMVREQGDFGSGWERWRILAERDKTRVQYHAMLVPGYRMLPLIGPWILKSNLRRMLLGAAKTLETLAPEPVLRALIDEHGVSAEDVAEILGVVTQTVHVWLIKSQPAPRSGLSTIRVS